ncbi:MAG: hypothetical protein WA813_20255 [Beijerinckiaceae bacterium]
MFEKFSLLSTASIGYIENPPRPVGAQPESSSRHFQSSVLGLIGNMTGVDIWAGFIGSKASRSQSHPAKQPATAAICLRA